MTTSRIAALLICAPLATCSAADRAGFDAFVTEHCLDCHDQTARQGGLALDQLLRGEIAPRAETWEKVARKLASRQMPPPDAPRPPERDRVAAAEWLESALDSAARRSPNPGRGETFRRLNRTEYQNAIRDLLHLKIDVAALLPPDEASHGFDNVTVADLSPTLVNRYLAAAEKISRLAVGTAPAAPRGETFRVRPDITQDSHLEGLPLGTRGGALLAHNFPVAGEYAIQIRLMRDRNEEVEGL
ncbi:MAG: DUF1587 domain-containing protein, partial [Pirellulaceae bacterium]|nr:DUF1587 domain-containing protein [Pirellulaceae bacterium]